MVHPIAKTPRLDEFTLPDGPRLPSVLQSFRFGRNAAGFLLRCREAHGPTFRLRFPMSPPVVVTSDAVLMQDLLSGNANDMPPYPANRALKSIFGTESLLFKSGPDHRADRADLTPALNRSATERAIADVDTAVEQAITDLSEASTPISAYAWAYKLSLRVAIKLFWGCRDDDLIQEIEETVEVSRTRHQNARHMIFDSLAMEQDDMPIASRLASLVQGRTRDRLRSKFKSQIQRQADAIRSDPNDYGPSPFKARLATYDPSSDVTDGFVDFCMTLLIAAYDPPASAIAWSLLELAHHPSAQSKIRDEATAQASDGFGQGIGHLSSLVQEVCRLYPPLHSITRTTSQPLQWGAYNLPAGTYLAPSIFLLHRESAHWDAPDQFQPGRFVGQTQKISLADGYLPFGAQSRACPGRHFAITIVERALRHLIGRFDIQKIDPVPAPITFGPTLVPDEKSRILLVARDASNGTNRDMT